MRTRVGLLSVLAFALSLAIAATASASVKSQTARFYKIMTAEQHQALNVKESALTTRLKAAENLLTPSCLNEIFAGKRNSSPYGISDRHRGDLAVEALAQVEFKPVIPAYKPQVTAMRKLSSLKIVSTKHRKYARSVVSGITGVANLNMCADLKKWQKAGWKASAKPSGVTAAFNALSPGPASSSNNSDYYPSRWVKLAPPEKHALAKLTKRADKHFTAITEPIFKAANKWLKQDGFS